jgi:hypothetical protein
MSLRRAISFGLTFIALTICVLPQDEPRPVSIVQLVANPEKYDGKVVFGIGFLNVTREGSLLYLGKEDYDHVILENAIWVNRTENLWRDREKLDLKYVKFVGTFKAGHKGHAYYQSGGIADLTSCVFWSDPEHPVRQNMALPTFSPR